MPEWEEVLRRAQQVKAEKNAAEAAAVRAAQERDERQLAKLLPIMREFRAIRDQARLVDHDFCAVDVEEVTGDNRSYVRPPDGVTRFVWAYNVQVFFHVSSRKYQIRTHYTRHGGQELQYEARTAAGAMDIVKAAMARYVLEDVPMRRTEREAKLQEQLAEDERKRIEAARRAETERFDGLKLALGIGAMFLFATPAGWFLLFVLFTAALMQSCHGSG